MITKAETNRILMGFQIGDYVRPIVTQPNRDYPPAVIYHFEQHFADDVPQAMVIYMNEGNKVDVFYLDTIRKCTELEIETWRWQQRMK